MNVLSLLSGHARSRPHKPAYVFLQDGEQETETVSYARLADAVDSAAAVLAAHCAPGERVVLALPEGIDFVLAFLACLHAGIVAVPVKPPHNRESARKLLAIAADCGASLLVCSPAQLGKLHAFFPQAPALAGLRHLDEAVLRTAPAGAAPGPAEAAHTGGGLAYLQYTSGSTGAPKGVRVTHANVFANEEMIRLRWGSSEADVILSWLPMFHDMGLVAIVLHALYLGATCVLMPPMAFVQKPARWMAAVSRYRATITGGPNFAFRAIGGDRALAAAGPLDLSSLRVVFCGSEPVAPGVVLEFLRRYQAHGFDACAFSAGYGMAEATLMVSAGGIGRPAVFAELPPDGMPRLLPAEGVPHAQRPVVSCGQLLQHQVARIVDPATLRALPDGSVGEIWLHGAHVADGYWNKPEATEASFGATLADEGARRFLRSGDLGFMLGGELFVTGRIKELMIFNGANHYPQDIEEALVGCHPALSLGRAVAFSVPAAQGEQLVVVQELNRDAARQLTPQQAGAIAAAMRSAVYAAHAVPIAETVLVRLNSIPRTTSGKICRVSCKRHHAGGLLEVVPLAAAAAQSAEPVL